MDISKYRTEDIRRKSEVIPLDVMVTGVTGAGKSTTLNSLFQKSVAKVGNGVDPETMQLGSYRLNDWLRLWDTPGLGDGLYKDNEHTKNIKQLLSRNFLDDGDLYGFVDIALIIIEGSKRDLGTTIKLLEEVILPNIESNRVLVAINQADIAMKGRNWDQLNNRPNMQLKAYLDDFANSLRGRLLQSTGLLIPKPIYYSAEKNYNIEAFMDFIIDNIPTARRPPINVRAADIDESYTDIKIVVPTFHYEKEEGWVEFSFERIENLSHECTGELKVICWISNQKYSFDDEWGSKRYMIDQRYLGHVEGRESLEVKDIRFDLPSREIPIKGHWNFVFTINELQSNAQWLIVEYCNAGDYYNL